MRADPAQALAIVVALLADEDDGTLSRAQALALVWWWHGVGAARA
jgi:hypothetical protein